MGTLKKIVIWIGIMIIIYIVTDFANFYIMASTYKNIEAQTQKAEDINIINNEIKATYVNGYAKIKIINNSGVKIDSKYILLDGYSKYNNCITNKYIEVNNLEPGEERDIQIPFKAQEVKKINIYASDKIQDRYEQTTQIIDGPTLLITSIIFLYFFG